MTGKSSGPCPPTSHLLRQLEDPPGTGQAADGGGGGRFIDEGKIVGMGPMPRGKPALKMRGRGTTDSEWLGN